MTERENAEVFDWAYPFTDQTHMQPRPVPRLAVVERDGRGLFYPDKTNWLYGVADACKSWIVLWAAVQHARRSEDALALYIDAEDSPSEFAYRMNALGAYDLVMSGAVQYIDDDQVDEHGEFLARVALDCMDKDLFVVIDSATETGAGQDLEAITKWKAKYLQVGWPEHTGFLVTDHMTKESEAMLRNPEFEMYPPGPFGSQNKKALLRGALWLAHEGPEGAWTAQSTGAIHLMCQKDKPGGGFKKGVWSVKIVGTPDNGKLSLSAQLISAQDQALNNMLTVKIFDAVRAEPGINRTGIKRALNISQNDYPHLASRLEDLTARGELLEERQGASYKYTMPEATP